MRDHVSPRAVLGLHPVGFAVETTEGRRTRFCRRACSRAAEPPHSNRMWRDALRYLATASAKGRGATVQSQCSRLGPRTTMITLLTCAAPGPSQRSYLVTNRSCVDHATPRSVHFCGSRSSTLPGLAPSPPRRAGRRLGLGLGSSARCAVEGNATTKRLATTCRAQARSHGPQLEGRTRFSCSKE